MLRGRRKPLHHSFSLQRLKAAGQSAAESAKQTARQKLHSSVYPVPEKLEGIEAGAAAVAARFGPAAQAEHPVASRCIAGLAEGWAVPWLVGELGAAVGLTALWNRRMPDGQSVLQTAERLAASVLAVSGTSAAVWGAFAGLGDAIRHYQRNEPAPDAWDAAWARIQAELSESSFGHPRASVSAVAKATEPLETPSEATRRAALMQGVRAVYPVLPIQPFPVSTAPNVSKSQSIRIDDKEVPITEIPPHQEKEKAVKAFRLPLPSSRWRRFGLHDHVMWIPPPVVPQPNVSYVIPSWSDMEAQRRLCGPTVWRPTRLGSVRVRTNFTIRKHFGPAHLNFGLMVPIPMHRFPPQKGDVWDTGARDLLDNVTALADYRKRTLSAHRGHAPVDEQVEPGHALADVIPLADARSHPVHV